MPALSIIIPTYRRSDILRACLECLAKQTIASELEVIVVSDGYDPSTHDMFTKNPLPQASFPIRCLEIPKSQQGVARNRGVALAQAPYCLFIGDDIFLEPDACAIHLATHDMYTVQEQRQSAVLGYTTWDPALEITPVMRWLEESGWQFGYPLIHEYAQGIIPPHLQHRFTYTSHLSLSTKQALAYPFREDCLLYGWEDIEWGMRLREAGITLTYRPDAIALHHHLIDLEQSLQRMEILGRSAVTLQSSLPYFDRVPKGWKLLAYRLAARLPTMAGKHRWAFLRGIDAERRAKAV